MNNVFKKGGYSFASEGVFNMFMSSFQLILGEDLESYSKSKDQLFGRDNPCNIYFILKRPKVTIDPESFHSIGPIAQFNLIIQQRDGFSVVSMGAEFLKAKTDLELRSEYPYNIFSIRDKSQTLLVARPTTLIDTIPLVDNIQLELLDYEILYIGQAYGKKGKRTAYDRLSAHETLQKIYTHSLSQNPESDIWIMLTSFSPVSTLITMGDKFISKKYKNKDRDEYLVKSFFENDGFTFSERQKINFTEAALIKYFEPKYNIEFKDNFPSEKHKSYNECYKLDIRTLNIEVDTSDLIRNLYTTKIGRKNYHSVMFEFKNDDDRLSLLGMYNS